MHALFHAVSGACRMLRASHYLAHVPAFHADTKPPACALPLLLHHTYCLFTASTGELLLLLLLLLLLPAAPPLLLCNVCHFSSVTSTALCNSEQL
jgi:hypothetical protein